MKQKIKIMYLPTKRWKEIRNIRLCSLELEPLAFAADKEEEKLSPKEKYVQRLKQKQTIVAEIDKELVGFIGFKKGNRNRSKHTAEVGPLFITPEFRRTGIATKLFRFLVKEAKKVRIEKLKLNVNKANKGAYAFYKKVGFRKTGFHKGDFKINGKYYDIIIMEKWI